jgi:hypothetical protein
MLEHGLAETRPRLPHSEGIFARLPVAFAHAAEGAVTSAGSSVHSKE